MIINTYFHQCVFRWFISTLPMFDHSVHLCCHCFLFSAFCGVFCHEGQTERSPYAAEPGSGPNISQGFFASAYVTCQSITPESAERSDSACDVTRHIRCWTCHGSEQQQGQMCGDGEKTVSGEMEIPLHQPHWWWLVPTEWTLPRDFGIHPHPGSR